MVQPADGILPPPASNPSEEIRQARPIGTFRDQQMRVEAARFKKEQKKAELIFFEVLKEKKEPLDPYKKSARWIR